MDLPSGRRSAVTAAQSDVQIGLHAHNPGDRLHGPLDLFGVRLVTDLAVQYGHVSVDHHMEARQVKALFEAA